MPLNQHNLKRLKDKVVADKDNIKALELECTVYRRILSDLIDSYIKELQSPITDFSIENYGLKRAFRDGGAYQLQVLKGIINDR